MFWKNYVVKYIYEKSVNRNLWRDFLNFPLFLTLCGISKGNKGIFYLVVACHFIKKSGGVPLCLSCRVGVDIHCGTDIRVP